MQLRTRLIVANTPLKGQTKVRVGHEVGLFQGERRIQRIDDLFIFVWLQVEYCLLREKRCQLFTRPSVLQHYTAHL